MSNLSSVVSRRISEMQKSKIRPLKSPIRIRPQLPVAAPIVEPVAAPIVEPVAAPIVEPVVTPAITPRLSLVTTDPVDQVTIGMASIPERETGMLRVLSQLLPQCDNFDLSLNGYPADYVLPVSDPKLIVYRNDNSIGPHGKLFMAHRASGYFLTVDDDLIYPANYVYTMVQGIEKYKRSAFVGFHGSLIAEHQDAMQPPCRCLFSHQDLLERDMPVHMIGTAIFGYHSSVGPIDWRTFILGKIDDQVAAWAQDRRIPMVCLAHPGMWIIEDKDLYLKGTALRRNTEASKAQVARIQARNWKLYLPNNWKAYYR